MKKAGVYFSLAVALALTGSAFIYYPEIENFLSSLLQQENQNAAKEDPLQKPSQNEQKESEERIVTLTADQTEKMGIEIQTAAPGKMTLTLSTRGKIILDPDKMAHIAPKVSGIALQALKNLGSTVKAGELIAVLESQDIAYLKASYLAAVSKEKLAVSFAEREKSLYQKGISSAQDYLNAQNTWEEARINLLLASQKLQAYGLSKEAVLLLPEQNEADLRNYDIYAPIDGTVLMRHLTKGEFVEQNATIYEIADLSAVLVETVIYPRDLNRIQKGQQVEVVNLENLATAKATLIYLSPTIAGETIAAKALALLNNPEGQWRPGLFVTVNIATEEITPPIAISKDAVQKMDGCDCAFVKTDKGYEKREIKLGRSDHQVVEVLSGLMPGEKYVAKNPFLLKAEMNKDSAKDED